MVLSQLGLSALDSAQQFTVAEALERVAGQVLAYFATDVPIQGTLTVGFGTEVTAVIPLTRVRPRLTRLDQARIEGRYHRVTLRSPGAFRVRE